MRSARLFAILQKYDFSSKSQLTFVLWFLHVVVCDTAKVRFFKQITTIHHVSLHGVLLFAILQKYDFSSKSQRSLHDLKREGVVCDTAKVRFFKQITTNHYCIRLYRLLFAILQKYDFSSKSQQTLVEFEVIEVVCDTAKVRFFKQITTSIRRLTLKHGCLRYCKSTIFQANHNLR